jgi:hypothetical protein
MYLCIMLFKLHLQMIKAKIYHIPNKCIEKKISYDVKTSIQSVADLEGGSPLHLFSLKMFQSKVVKFRIWCQNS